ncbi:hypothetical protein J6590_000764 [Homalodisca vitripennis]|nr:hypothetical protein J6590_000764 [Homalodisca vitripennis]
MHAHLHHDLRAEKFVILLFDFGSGKLWKLVDGSKKWVDYFRVARIALHWSHLSICINNFLLKKCLTELVKHQYMGSVTEVEDLVNALLSLNEGAHFGGVNQPFVAEKLRLGPQGATSLVVKLIATGPGVKNMTAVHNQKLHIPAGSKRRFNVTYSWELKSCLGRQLHSGGVRDVHVPYIQYSLGPSKRYSQEAKLDINLHRDSKLY